MNPPWEDKERGDDKASSSMDFNKATATVFDVDWHPFFPPTKEDNNGTHSLTTAPQSFHVMVIPKIKKPQQVDLDDLRLPWHLSEAELQQNDQMPRRRKSLSHYDSLLSNNCQQTPSSLSQSNTTTTTNNNKEQKQVRKSPNKKKQVRRKSLSAKSPSASNVLEETKDPKLASRGRSASEKGLISSGGHNKSNTVSKPLSSAKKRSKSRPRSSSRPRPSSRSQHGKEEENPPVNKRLEIAKSKIQKLFAEQRQKEQSIREEHARTFGRPCFPADDKDNKDTEAVSMVGALSPPRGKKSAPNSSGSVADEATRRWRIWGWYRKLALPDRALFKELVAQDYCSPDVSPEDVDLLPWAANGAVVAIPDLMKLLPASPSSSSPSSSELLPRLEKATAAVRTAESLDSPNSPVVSPRPILKKSKWSKGPAIPVAPSSRKEAEQTSKGSQDDQVKDHQEKGNRRQVIRVPKAKVPALRAALGEGSRHGSSTKRIPQNPSGHKKALRRKSLSDVSRGSAFSNDENNSNIDHPPKKPSSSSCGAFASARQVFLRMEEQQKGGDGTTNTTTTTKLEQTPAHPKVMKREESSSSVATASTCGESVSGRSKDDEHLSPSEHQPRTQI